MLRSVFDDVFYDITQGNASISVYGIGALDCGIALQEIRCIADTHIISRASNALKSNCHNLLF
jgi:hypothetical protein